jgi:hypothetical protein
MISDIIVHSQLGCVEGLKIWVSEHVTNVLFVLSKSIEHSNNLSCKSQAY